MIIFDNPKNIYAGGDLFVKIVEFPRNERETMRMLALSILAPWSDLRFNEKGEMDLMDSEVDLIFNKIVKKEVFVGQALEGISYAFAVSGISRTCTHQLVRHRIGIGFNQQSERETDFRYFSFKIPQSFCRNCCSELYARVLKSLDEMRVLYADLVDSGVPEEDARFILPQGVLTNIMVYCNLRAFSNFFRSRTRQGAQWEIKQLAYKMKGEIVRVTPNLAKLI